MQYTSAFKEWGSKQEARTFWMFAGWFSVSFGSVDASLTAWDRLLEVPAFEIKFPPCPWSSSGMEGSPSTINSESGSDFGSASGASDSNKILSEGTYKRKLDFLKFSAFGIFKL